MAIKVLRSDRGGEYLSDAFNAHLAAAGMARKLTVHDTLQLNGVAERLNHTLLERIRAFAHGSGLPKSLWGKAVRHAVWLKNRTGTRALDGKTPFQALFGRPLDLSSPRVWGSRVWVHGPDRSKLDVRAREARWLGVDVDAKAHRVFWPGTGTVTVERNVYFATSAQFEGEETIIPISRGEQPDASNTPITSLPEPPSLASPLTPLSSASPPESPPAPLPSQLPPLRCPTRTRRWARANAQRRYHRLNACFEVPARECRRKPEALPPDGERERDTTLQGRPNEGDCKSSWPSREPSHEVVLST